MKTLREKVISATLMDTIKKPCTILAPSDRKIKTTTNSPDYEVNKKNRINISFHQARNT
jgi:hypothetical protein